VFYLLYRKKINSPVEQVGLVIPRLNGQDENWATNEIDGTIVNNTIPALTPSSMSAHPLQSRNI
jgi:hypothetical protein